jgi:DNA polymerase delta subunit 2
MQELEIEQIIGQNTKRVCSPIFSHNQARFAMNSQVELTQQYASLYFVRLNKLRSAALDQARKLWKNAFIAENSVQMAEREFGSLFVVAGILYKHVKQFSHVVPGLFEDEMEDAEISIQKFEEHDDDEEELEIEERNEDSSRKRRFKTYYSEEDSVVIEDEFGRTALQVDSSELKNSIVHGVVGAVLLEEQASGKLLLRDICYPGLAPIPSPDISKLGKSSKYIAIVSGLGIMDGNANPIRLDLLADFLTGYVGDDRDQSLAASISHLIIAGDIMQSSKKLKLLGDTTVGSKKKTADAAEARVSLLSGVQELDSVVSELCDVMNVVVIPGSSDPTTYSWPQCALNKNLFPRASKKETLYSFPNPALLEVDGFKVLATSGDNLQDVRRFSKCTTKVDESLADVMEQVLKYRHIAPTAPDTLHCFPFAMTDPFVLDETPNIFVSGDKYGDELSFSKISEHSIAISVPHFSRTGLVALLELPSLKVAQFQIL